MLVHGPFSAVLLLTVISSRLASDESVRDFDYRNFRPLYVGEELTVCVRRVERSEGRGSWEVWIQGVDGKVAIEEVRRLVFLKGEGATRPPMYREFSRPSPGIF